MPETTSPFFTIITATRNAATTLPILLTSLASQTCHSFRWIVQDGGSTDGTLEIIEAWRHRLPDVSVQNTSDKGIYDAWNKALDRAGDSLGQWVLFLGADDALFTPESLDVASRSLIAMPEGILVASGGARIIGVAGHELMSPQGIGTCDALHWTMPFCHTALFHRSEVFAALRFDTRYKILGDYDFICRLLRHDAEVGVVPHTITDMRRGGISSSLCMQPAIFKEACHIAWMRFGRLHRHHLAVGVKVSVVALLCRLLGASRAERAMDALRLARGKHPVWHNPPSLPHLYPTACAIVVVHYNNAADTLACLNSLLCLSSPPAHVVVVDNGSHPAERDALQRAWNSLCMKHGQVLMCSDAQLDTFHGLPMNLLLCIEKNTGFAGGNNAALRILLQHTNCTSFWLLNNDTEPAPEALNALCSRLNERPEAGLCGSTLIYAHTPETVQAAGGSSLSLWMGTSKFLCGGRKRDMVESLPPQDVRRIESKIRYIVGASCLVRREVFEQVGVLPEEYFLYYEDAAFSLSAARAGFVLAWARDSIVMHKEGGSTQAYGGEANRVPARPAYVDYLTVRNRVALVRRYNPWALPVVLASLMGVYANRVRRGQADRLGHILRAAWHGLICKMGPPACCGAPPPAPSTSPQPPAM